MEGTGCRVMSPGEAADSLPRGKEAELDGVDIVVDCTGNPEALEKAVGWMRRGGVICVFGISPMGEEAR